MSSVQAVFQLRFKNIFCSERFVRFQPFLSNLDVDIYQIVPVYTKSIITNCEIITYDKITFTVYMF